MHFDQVMKATSMNHTEGGWPKEVKSENAESKNKYVRKIHKEEMYKYTMSKLSEAVNKVLKENQTLHGMDQSYYDDTTDTDNRSMQENFDKDTTPIRVVARFKDFSKQRRPVSYVSWSSCSRHVLAISHCSPNFLACNSCHNKDSYICDVTNTSAPLLTLTGPGHMTTHDYNDKTPSLLAAGCYDGSVCCFDTRSSNSVCLGVSSFDESHQDSVYGVRWMGKTGHEFLSGSQDGRVKWWDVRKAFKKKLYFLFLTHPRAEGYLEAFKKFKILF